MVSQLRRDVDPTKIPKKGQMRNVFCSQAVESQFTLVVRSIIKLGTNLKKVFTPGDPEVVRLPGPGSREQQQEIALGQDVESHL